MREKVRDKEDKWGGKENERQQNEGKMEEENKGREQLVINDRRREGRKEESWEKRKQKRKVELGKW